MRTLRLAVILLSIPVWNSLATAEPKPLLAMTRADEIQVRYEFSRTVQCATTSGETFYPLPGLR